jgi:hypothetical protein
MQRFLAVFSLIGLAACGDVSVGENAVITPDVIIAPKTTPTPTPEPVDEVEPIDAKQAQVQIEPVEAELEVIEPELEPVPEWPKQVRMTMMIHDKQWWEMTEYACDAVVERDEITLRKSISYHGTCGGIEVDFDLEFSTHAGMLRDPVSTYFGLSATSQGYEQLIQEGSMIFSAYNYVGEGETRITNQYGFQFKIIK